MARCGNHGQQIPRDRRLMESLYFGQGLSLPKIAEIYGVTHKSIERVFTELGIPRRKHTAVTHCIVCDSPVQKIPHKLTKAGYGRHCAECRREHRNGLAREYIKLDYVAVRRKQEMQRWYLYGPLNPQGELQWINKGRAILRTIKRHLARSQSPNAASAPAPTSQT